jgi:hypothetical protein
MQDSPRSSSLVCSLMMNLALFGLTHSGSTETGIYNAGKNRDQIVHACQQVSCHAVAVISMPCHSLLLHEEYIF